MKKNILKKKKFYGIGKTMLRISLIKSGLSFKNININSKNFNIFIEDNLDLKKNKLNKIKTLKVLNLYKSFRLKNNLPLNGQNTKNNAKTRKKYNII